MTKGNPKEYLVWDQDQERQTFEGSSCWLQFQTSWYIQRQICEEGKLYLRDRLLCALILRRRQVARAGQFGSVSYHSTDHQ